MTGGLGPRRTAERCAAAGEDASACTLSSANHDPLTTTSRVCRAQRRTSARARLDFGRRRRGDDPCLSARSAPPPDGHQPQLPLPRSGWLPRPSTMWVGPRPRPLARAGWMLLLTRRPCARSKGPSSLAPVRLPPPSPIELAALLNSPSVLGHDSNDAGPSSASGSASAAAPPDAAVAASPSPVPVVTSRAGPPRTVSSFLPTPLFPHACLSCTPPLYFQTKTSLSSHKSHLHRASLTITFSEEQGPLPPCSRRAPAVLLRASARTDRAHPSSLQPTSSRAGPTACSPARRVADRRPPRTICASTSRAGERRR